MKCSISVLSLLEFQISLLLFTRPLNDKSLTHFLHGNLSQFIRSCLKCNHKSSIFRGHSVKPLSPGLFTVQQVTLLQLKFPLEKIHLLNNIRMSKKCALSSLKQVVLQTTHSIVLIKLLAAD